MSETDIARLTRERDEAKTANRNISLLLARCNDQRIDAESRAARLEKALREIADECDGPAHGIARAALGEEGK